MIWETKEPVVAHSHEHEHCCFVFLFFSPFASESLIVKRMHKQATHKSFLSQTLATLRRASTKTFRSFKPTLFTRSYIRKDKSKPSRLSNWSCRLCLWSINIYQGDWHRDLLFFPPRFTFLANVLHFLYAHEYLCFVVKGYLKHWLIQNRKHPQILAWKFDDATKPNKKPRLLVRVNS